MKPLKECSHLQEVYQELKSYMESLKEFKATTTKLFEEMDDIDVMIAKQAFTEEFECNLAEASMIAGINRRKKAREEKKND